LAKKKWLEQIKTTIIKKQSDLPMSGADKSERRKKC
jgi:hypothetical protein